ncbi:MAG: Asp-tRNA(Asn)/Glu-tRNA(Gln) amidotransferase subunit GatC [Parcubacteria group bacterium]|nr:Asp-tRNA(Asn)/Glu-tRNA(Gln) amidotransferase subunit GatC [Parcubacteria group bacterium]
MDKGEIEKLARLTRLAVSESEAEAFAKDIEKVLGYVSMIQKISTEESVSFGAPSADALYNVMREDVEPHESGVHTEALMAEVPEKENGFMKVKKIL